MKMVILQIRPVIIVVVLIRITVLIVLIAVICSLRPSVAWTSESHAAQHARQGR